MKRRVSWGTELWGSAAVTTAVSSDGTDAHWALCSFAAHSLTLSCKRLAPHTGRRPISAESSWVEKSGNLFSKLQKGWAQAKVSLYSPAAISLQMLLPLHCLSGSCPTASLLKGSSSSPSTTQLLISLLQWF